MASPFLQKQLIVTNRIWWSGMSVHLSLFLLVYTISIQSKIKKLSPRNHLRIKRSFVSLEKNGHPEPPKKYASFERI